MFQEQTSGRGAADDGKILHLQQFHGATLRVSLSAVKKLGSSTGIELFWVEAMCVFL
jgi:hypothetical protein